MRPLGFDAFCGGGGCTRGYQLAGFDMWGADMRPQPRYVGSRFFEADALELLADLDFMAQFSFVHASPPCQAHTSLRVMRNARQHADLVAETRELLRATGLPYVIENVPGAPLERPFLLCGSMFGLGVPSLGRELRRHRLFETNWPMGLLPSCAHQRRTVGVYGDHLRLGRRSSDGEFSGPRAVAYAAEALGIDWMTWPELAQAVPPAYTELIGHQLMQHVRARQAA